MAYWTDEYSFWTGVQIAPDRGVFLLGDDEMMEKQLPHAVVALYEGDSWVPKPKGLEWSAISVCWATAPVTEVIVVGYEGHILAGPLDDMREETQIQIDREDDKSGFLKCVRSIDGRAYIGGMDRQVYRRTANRGWEAVDAGLPYEEEEVVSIEAIDGFSEDEIYAAGRRGEIWRFDGTRWHAVESPTNVVLLGVSCGDDGNVYACGQLGTILRGRNDTWEVVEQTVTDQDFWDIVWFKGAVYLATRKLLYVLKDGVLAPVDYGNDDIDIPFSFYRFAASEKELWTIGSKDVMRFDGVTWSRID
jgi:hypothetical protein